MIGLLLRRGLRRDWGRVLCGVLGVAGAVGVLAWHVGLAWSLRSAGDDAAIRATAPWRGWFTGASTMRGMGPGRGADADANVAKGEGLREEAGPTMGRRPPGGGAGALPPGFAESLRAVPGVGRVLEMETVGATLDVRPGGRVLQGPPFRLLFAEMPRDGGVPFEAARLEQGRWPDPAADVPEIAVNAALFGRRVPLPALGESVTAVLARGTAQLRVVGAFRMGDIVAEFPTAYANPAAFRALRGLAGGPPRGANLVLAEAPGLDPDAFARAVAELPGAPQCTFGTPRALAERFRSDAVKNALSAMPLSLSMATLTAVCLLATLMTLGVSLRKRRLAILRCAGLTRGEAGRLCLAELSLTLAAGWALGLLAAWLALAAFLAWGSGGELAEHVRFGAATPLAGAALAVVAGLLAGAWPIRAAMRVRPLEMRAEELPAPARLPARRAVLAAALLLPMPLLSVAPWSERAKLVAGLAVGLPCLAAGLWMAIPALLRLAEALFCRPLGALLRLDPRLLRRRLARQGRRLTGVVLTLALGLGGYVAVHVWGGTLMSSFVPSPEWPDAIVSALPNGLSDADLAAIAESVPGIDRGRLLPIDCFQLPVEPLAEGTRAPDGAVLFFGAPVEEAFGGSDPMMRLRWVEGTPDEALPEVAAGRACILVAMLSRLTGLHRGDRLRVADRELDVAGVVDLNWHLVTSRAQVRTRFGKPPMPAGAPPAGRPDASPPGPPPRTAGMAFVSLDFVRSLTRNDATYFFWADLAPDLRALGPLAGSVRLDEQLRAALPAAAERNAIQVHHRDEIADGTVAHGNDLLGAMARLPLWSLVVTCGGIAVLLVAGARASKREFATMRAVGMTRSQLRRLLLGEGLLAALTAALLGVLGGGLVGWSFTGLSRWVMAAGLPVTLDISWSTVGKGVALEVALCLFMALLGARLATRGKQDS